jgi:tRNA (guanine-N7-)-methyltransferase
VNNSNSFCLPSAGAPAITESIPTEDKTKSRPNFLLNVPASEDSLAHRRHVCSRLIPHSRYSLTNPLNLEKIFGLKAPLHVDLGSGDGSFLCALAQRLPDKNFLGIERLPGRVRSAARRAASLDNVRFLQMESFYAVQFLLPAESVETFYLLFPDPWPKRRHHGRRIVTPDFLNSVHVAIQRDGVIYIATDHHDYFQKIKETAESTPGFAIDDVDVDLPHSRFWLIFAQKSATIYRLALRKVSPVR